MAKKEGDKLTPSSMPYEDEGSHDAVYEAFDALAKEGRIVDSGRRRFSKRIGRYEIVWVVADPPKKPH